MLGVVKIFLQLALIEWVMSDVLYAVDQIYSVLVNTFRDYFFENAKITCIWDSSYHYFLPFLEHQLT